MFHQKLKKDLVIFQESLDELRQDLQGISPLWQDEKFSELQESVTTLASNARSVLGCGEQCIEELARFQAISAEKF